MTTHHLMNFCRQSGIQEKYGTQIYWDISKNTTISKNVNSVICSLQEYHDNFVGFSGEEFTKQRKQQILNAIQFLKDYSDNVNLGNMTISFVEY